MYSMYVCIVYIDVHSLAHELTFAAGRKSINFSLMIVLMVLKGPRCMSYTVSEVNNLIEKSAGIIIVQCYIKL